MITLGLLGALLATPRPVYNLCLPANLAKMASIAKSESCQSLSSELEPCLGPALEDDAQGFLTGDRSSAVSDLLKSMKKTRPEENSLAGVRLPDPLAASELEKTCHIERRSAGGRKAAECFFAVLANDLCAWERGDPSRFAQALKAVRGRYEAYRSGSGFQDSRWGMSATEVSRLFPKASRDDVGDLSVAIPVAEYPAMVRFRFVDGRLWSVDVSFEVDATRPDQDVRRTLELRRLLTSKYGKPSVRDGSPSERAPPIEGLLNEVGGTGRAVRAGRVVLKASWATEDSNVELMLGSAIGDYGHHLLYESKVFARRARAAQDAHRASGL